MIAAATFLAELQKGVGLSTTLGVRHSLGVLGGIPRGSGEPLYSKVGVCRAGLTFKAHTLLDFTQPPCSFRALQLLKVNC